MLLVRSKLALCLLLTVLSYLAVAPKLWRTGTNVVTKTYHSGAARYLAKTDLYQLPLEAGDRFEYSPFFAQIYSHLIRYADQTEAAVWALINCLIFWIGVTLWLPGKGRHFSVLSLVALAVVSFELNISLLYQQINALLAGLILVAAYCYRADRKWVAGTVITVAANIKLFPVLFLAAMLPRGGGRFVGGVALGSLVCLLAPAWQYGFVDNLWIHGQWLYRVIDTLTVFPGHPWDLAHVLEGFHQPQLSGIAYYGIMAITLAVALAALLIPASEQKKIFGPLVMLLMSALLLLSPMTESPTYILAAPAYLFLAQWISDWWIEKRWILSVMGGAVFIAAAFLMTIAFTDLWPKSLWQPTLPFKTLGLCGLWISHGAYLGWSIARSVITKLKTRIPASRVFAGQH